MKYRQRPAEVEAARWFKNGDHPRDQSVVLKGTDGSFLSEGKVVRYFRRPDVDGEHSCAQCGAMFDHHGWIDSGGAGQKVCPGDYILSPTPELPRYRPCRPALFVSLYEEAGEPEFDGCAVGASK